MISVGGVLLVVTSSSLGVWRNAWDSGTTYSAGDLMTSAGATWRALRTVASGGSAPSEGADYTVVAAKGSAGAAGAAGRDSLGAVRSAIIFATMADGPGMAYDGTAKTITIGANINVNTAGVARGVPDLAAGDRVIVIFTTVGDDQRRSGPYVITNVGADDPSGHAAVFTRATDFDASGDIQPGAHVFISDGDDKGTWYYLETEPGAGYVLDTTRLVWAQTEVKTDGYTTEVHSGAVRVKAEGITTNELDLPTRAKLAFDAVAGGNIPLTDDTPSIIGTFNVGVYTSREVRVVVKAQLDSDDTKRFIQSAEVACRRGSSGNTTVMQVDKRTAAADGGGIGAASWNAVARSDASGDVDIVFTGIAATPIHANAKILID